MGRKKKKGKTASSCSFTRELVSHNQNALQVLLSIISMQLGRPRGRIHTNSISAVLHVPILNPFSASCATIILREVALGGAHASAKRSCKRPPFPISRNQNQCDWQEFRTNDFNPGLVRIGRREALPVAGAGF